MWEADPPITITSNMICAMDDTQSVCVGDEGIWSDMKCLKLFFWSKERNNWSLVLLLSLMDKHDLGGPIVTNTNDGLVQVGITSPISGKYGTCHDHDYSLDKYSAAKSQSILSSCRKKLAWIQFAPIFLHVSVQQLIGSKPLFALALVSSVPGSVTRNPVRAHSVRARHSTRFVVM